MDPTPVPAQQHPVQVSNSIKMKVEPDSPPPSEDEHIDPQVRAAEVRSSTQVVQSSSGSIKREREEEPSTFTAERMRRDLQRERDAFKVCYFS